MLSISNFCPVSVDKTFSEMYEKVFKKNMPVEKMNLSLRPSGKTTVITRCLEAWRSHLDKNCFVTAVMPDL